MLEYMIAFVHFAWIGVFLFDGICLVYPRGLLFSSTFCYGLTLVRGIDLDMEAVA